MEKFYKGKTKQERIDELNNLATELTETPEVKDKEYAKCYYNSAKTTRLTRNYSKLFKSDRKIL